MAQDWLGEKGKIQNYPRGYGLDNNWNKYISKKKKKKMNFEYI